MQRGNNQIITFLVATTFLIVLLVGLIITILYLYQKKRMLFNQHLAIAQSEIQEETFQHISREIHDNIGLSLTLAKLYLTTLNLNNSRDPAAIIESSIELIGQAINDLSDISKSLNSEAICNQGFLNVLRSKIDKIGESGKFKASIEVTGTSVFMDSQKELILYRITQEALNNIIKHSKATTIQVELNYGQTDLYLAIRDNGIGINWAELENPTPGKIMAGLNNIKMRTRLINGSYNIESSALGTAIFVTVPL